MTKVLSLLVTAALLGALVACGSDDGDSTAAPADDTSAPDTSDAATEATESDTTPSSGSQGATVTVSDGTTYELEVSECEGNNTDPSGYPDAGSFAIDGHNDTEDRSFYLARVGPSDEPYVQTGSLQGDSDENGQNEALIYSADMTTLDITLSGSTMSGSVNARAVGPNRPFGDETVVEFEFTC